MGPVELKRMTMLPQVLGKTNLRNDALNVGKYTIQLFSLITIYNVGIVVEPVALIKGHVRVHTNFHQITTNSQPLSTTDYSITG